MSKKDNNFIQRTFKNVETKENCNFEALLSNNISIILGEPASGKTYQLKDYEKKANVLFQELIIVDTNAINISGKDIILLDSIDEALTDYENFKQLQNKLTSYIQKCKEINPQIKFVITCRQLEWNEYFYDELKKLDKSLVVYQILDLEKADINILLEQNEIIQDEFWKFVSDNFLDSLLKNILIVQNITESYNEYKTTTTTYIDIYIDIIKRHLSVKGEYRKEISNESLTKFFDISSSLATYMILNRKATISIDNLSILADELYKVNNKVIDSNDLNTVLSTALFKKSGNDFGFFHKSVQEFLMAYFIDEKKLDIKTIKKLFSHELRFYEEFEEVIIYLTNLNNDLFEEFVQFDPFIFKRHPSLTKEQQEKLLTSMLYKLKNEKSMAWGRWRDFENTTIVKFDKLNNISTLIQQYIKSSDIDKVVFAYLMALLEYNYSEEIENLTFTYLENYSKNNIPSSNEEYDEISHSKFEGNKNLKELIEDNFIDNFDFNKRLFNFIKEKNLINSNSEKISVLDFETMLFESLYGIKYLNRYANDEKADFMDTGFDFNKLLKLLDAIPSRQLKYIVPYLKPMDTLKWLEHLNSKQDRENYHINCWCIYVVLLHNNSKDAIQKVFEFLNTNFCYMDNREFDEMSLDFERIADNFWEVYFSSELNTLFHIDSLLKILRVSLEDIKEAVLKYPIENYAEYYIKFRLNSDIDKYLMENSTFNSYMNDLWEKQKKQQSAWDNELKERLATSDDYQQRIHEKANYENICEESLKTLVTKKDFYTVFDCKNIHFDENYEQLHSLFTKEQHQRLLDFIEDDFKYDEVYNQIKNELFSNDRKYIQSALFIYLFKNSNNDKLFALAQSKENFQKICFYTFRFNKMKEKYFVLLASQYFDYFVEFIQELIKLSLEQSHYKDLVYLYELREVIEKIEKFNKSSLSNIIYDFLNLDKNIFKFIKEEYKIGEILKIISLDEQSYDFIDEVRTIDSDRAYLYLKYLFKIDTKKVLDDYFSEYQKVSTYIKFYKLKKLYADMKNKFGIQIKEEKSKNKYDKPNINPQKIKLFKDLILAFGNNINKEDLEDKYILNIIQDYYEFFREYKPPTGVYSPNEYDGMSEYVNSLFNYLSATSSHIDILKNLSTSANSRLVTRAKYHLKLAYDNQNKDRSHQNSYYKNIFDKESNVSKENIMVNAGNNNNININTGNGTIKQGNNDLIPDSKNNKWWNNWTIISLIVSITSGGLIYWTLNEVIVSVVIVIIVFLIMLLNNPKRRFFRMGWACILIGSPQFLSYSGVFIIPENKVIHGYLKIGETSFPFFGLLMIFGAFYLFWLDKNEK